MFLKKLEKFKIILASQSPRRQQLLKMMQIPFEVVVRQTDESYPDHLHREQVALFLAQKKAIAFEDILQKNTLVITADTIVVLGNEVIGKPADNSEAIAFLTRLSGRMHEVFTGVCISSEEKKELFFCRSEVYFKKLSASEINFYVVNYSPLDKAGAYGIQDWFGLTAIEKINGSFYNVMGLPTKELYDHLQKF